MMSLREGLTNKKFDKRVIDWNLRNGVITQAEYDQHVQGLSDEIDESVETVVFREKSAGKGNQDQVQ